MQIELNDELAQKLEQFAAATERSVDTCAIQAIEYLLEDWEDYQAAVAVLARNEKTISLEDLEQELGLAD